MKVVVSPLWMLKLLQFIKVNGLVVMVNCDPVDCAVADPDFTTKPDGLAAK